MPRATIRSARRPDLLVERLEDQLPVVDDDGRPAGRLDVQDILDVRL